MSFVNDLDLEKIYKIGPLIILALLFGALYLPLVSLIVDGDEQSFTAVEAGEPDDSGDEILTFDGIRQNLLIAIILVLVLIGIANLPNLQIYRKNNGFIGLVGVFFIYLALEDTGDLIDLMEFVVIFANAFGASAEVKRGLGYFSVWVSLLFLLVYSVLIIYREFGQGRDNIEETNEVAEEVQENITYPANDDITDEDQESPVK